MSEMLIRETFIEPAPSKSTPIETPFRDSVAGPVYRPDQKLEALRDFEADERVGELNGLLSQALLLIDNGDYRLAQAILRGALEKNPYFSEAIKWQSYCFRQLGDFENAIRCALARAKLDPGEESYCQLAELYYTVGHESESIKFYEKALAVIDYESPYLFEIYKNLGNICIRAGNLDAAEENYNRAYTLSPHSDVLLVNFGTLEIQRQNYDNAAERFCRRAPRAPAEANFFFCGESEQADASLELPKSSGDAASKEKHQLWFYCNRWGVSGAP